MTTELTKAAQQALERLKIHRSSNYCNACEAEDEEAISALERALTTSQPAPTSQDLERAAKMCDGFAAPDMAAALRGQPAQAGEVDEPNAKLMELADRIDHDQLWRLSGLEQMELPQDKQDRLLAGVMLRRYADLLGNDGWRIFPPRPGVSFRASTLDKVVEMARRDEARRGDLPTQPAAQATPEPVTWAPLKRPADGRAALLKFFMFKLKRHDFLDYITNTLAADFACVLGGYLQATATPTQQAAGEPVWEPFPETPQYPDGTGFCGTRTPKDYERHHLAWVNWASHMHARLRIAQAKAEQAMKELATHPAPGVPEVEPNEMESKWWLADELAEEAERRVCHVAMAPASLLKDAASELRNLLAANLHMKDLTDQALDDVRALTAERDQLRAEVERLRVDGERYQVLRCYELGGAWPDGFKAPAGLLVFSGGLTQHELDKVLDDMLGHLPHPSPGSVRADYQQWRRSQTLSAVAAIDAARTTHKETE